jgi:Asp-tRNA(Asn)/Glu-tRNA(Gln) amidotransferase A subunit family amidase
MLDVIAGGEASGPFVPGLPDSSFASRVGTDPGKLRIGVRVPSAINPTPDPEAYAAVDTAVRVLTELGHHVDELPQAPFDDAALAREFLLTWFVYTAWELADAKRLTGASDESF